MKIAALLLTALLALADTAAAAGLPTVRPEEVGLSSERLGRIAQVLKADVERGRIPGAVVLVARKGRVAYFEAVGFRDKATGAPMTKVHMAGTPGDYFWPGAYSTYFWVDPKLDLVVVSMLQSPLGRHYNPLMRSLVHQAIAE